MTLYNSSLFDLSNWKLTLPVDSKNSTKGTAVDVLNLTNYQSAYFYSGNDQAMIFKASVHGASTSGSTYARSELREMNNGKVAAWKLSQGGTMTATLKVLEAPLKLDGTPGKIVIGQIHGKKEELVRLYWDNDTVYFKNDMAGSKNTEMRFDLVNAAGQKPVIHLGDQFSYKIDAHGDTLKVNVYINGEDYGSTTKINSVWQSDTFYFKAGVYLGQNETNGTGEGEAAFYGLDFGHARGSGLGGLEENANAPAPVPDPVVTIPKPAPAYTVTGTAGKDVLHADHDHGTAVHGLAGNDTISGHDGHDMLYGGDGNDKLYGYYGNDIIIGGAGQDTLNGGPGSDVFKYESLTEAGDIIMDFHHLVGDSDMLDLTALFATNGLGGMDTAQALDEGYLVLSRKSDGLHVGFDRDGADEGAYGVVRLATLTGADGKNLDIEHQILTSTATS